MFFKKAILWWHSIYTVPMHQYSPYLHKVSLPAVLCKLPLRHPHRLLLSQMKNMKTNKCRQAAKLIVACARVQGSAARTTTWQQHRSLWYLWWRLSIVLWFSCKKKSLLTVQSRQIHTFWFKALVKPMFKTIENSSAKKEKWDAIHQVLRLEA